MLSAVRTPRQEHRQQLAVQLAIHDIKFEIRSSKCDIMQLIIQLGVISPATHILFSSRVHTVHHVDALRLNGFKALYQQAR